MSSEKVYPKRNQNNDLVSSQYLMAALNNTLPNYKQGSFTNQSDSSQYHNVEMPPRNPSETPLPQISIPVNVPRLSLINFLPEDDDSEVEQAV